MHMKKRILQLSVLVLAGTILAMAPAYAQKQTPPEGVPAKPFNLPANETYALPNGMKVTLVPYGIIPKATVSIAVDAGSLNERRDRIGVCDLVGDLFKEGTATLTSQQLAENAARMGSTLDVSMGSDQSQFGMDVLQEFAPDAVRLLGDVLQHPRFPESEVARLKNDMQRKIALQLSEPQTIAEIRFRKLLYGDHPYGTILATEDDAKKLTLQDVKEYYEANFGAQRSHIYVAGKFDVAAVKKAIAETFGNWAKGPAKLENVPSPKPNHVLDPTGPVPRNPRWSLACRSHRPPALMRFPWE
jgi:predicted Zn-dependent peptidase